MAEMQDYAGLDLFFNGAQLKQINSLELTLESGQTSIDLLNDDLGGFSPGAGRARITCGFVVPIGGMEEDFTAPLDNGEYVAMQVPIGNKTYAGTGKLITMSISKDAGAPLAGNFEWEGQLEKLK